jgi:long-subunit fatty acid transport protein
MTMVQMHLKRRRQLPKRISALVLSALCLHPCITYASFIESTIGTAVVNDATASYYNAAALVLLKNSQVIPQVTFASLNTRFNGQSTSSSTGLTESGVSTAHTHYFSPTLFMAMPVTEKVTLGLAVVTNAANRDTENNSVLRYVQSKNNIQDYDVVPAIALKLNDIFSIGGGVNFSYANFHLEPVTGIAGANTADSVSDNKCDGSGIGANLGFLIKPGPTTLVGFNYRSETTYRLSGTSIYEGSPRVVSNNYHFKLWTPARGVLSINHFVTPVLGFIGTVQRFQWSRLTNAHIYGIANVSGSTPVIVNGVVPYYLRDTWLFTLGTHYRITPKLILRVAGSYNQSPGNPHYQIATGNSIIFGASMGYELNKTISIDGSYAHAFINNENINIATTRNQVAGVNEASRDAVSLKLTFNV